MKAVYADPFVSISQHVHSPLYFYIRQNYECTLYSLLSFAAANPLYFPYQKGSCSGENCRISLLRPSCKRAVWVEVEEDTQGNTSLRQSLLDSNTNTLPCWALSQSGPVVFSLAPSSSFSPFLSSTQILILPCPPGTSGMFQNRFSSLFISVLTFFRSTLTPFQSVFLVSA